MKPRRPIPNPDAEAQRAAGVIRETLSIDFPAMRNGLLSQVEVAASVVNAPGVETAETIDNAWATERMIDAFVLFRTNLEGIQYELADRRATRIAVGEIASEGPSVTDRLFRPGHMVHDYVAGQIAQLDWCIGLVMRLYDTAEADWHRVGDSKRLDGRFAVLHDLMNRLDYERSRLPESGRALEKLRKRLGRRGRGVRE